MEYLDRYDVLAVVARVLRCETEDAVRRTELELLEKVLDQVRATVELPTGVAALVCGLIRERPFEGPTAMIAMALGLQFAAVNGHELELEPVEPLDELLVRIRRGESSEEEFAAFVRGRLSPVLDPFELGLVDWESEMMGRPDMFERFTEPAREVVRLARIEARQLDHAYVGTEHLLLGLIVEGAGPAAKILAGFGLSTPTVRETVREIVGPGTHDVTRSAQLPFTPRAKAVLDHAFQEARGFGQDELGPEHILIGLMRDRAGVAAQVAERLGADPEEIRTKVIERFDRRRRATTAVHEYLTEDQPPYDRGQQLMAGLTALLDENRRLHEEVERLRAENQRLSQENQRLHDRPED